MPGFYELNKSSDGQFRFLLKSDETHVVLTSETYRSRDSANKGIASVRGNCGAEKHFEKKQSVDGKFYFNLKAANHEVIGTSPMFASVELRDQALAAAKSSGASVTVKDNA